MAEEDEERLRLMDSIYDLVEGLTGSCSYNEKMTSMIHLQQLYECLEMCVESDSDLSELIESIAHLLTVLQEHLYQELRPQILINTEYLLFLFWNGFDLSSVLKCSTRTVDFKKWVCQFVVDIHVYQIMSLTKELWRFNLIVVVGWLKDHNTS